MLAIHRLTMFSLLSASMMLLLFVPSLVRAQCSGVSGVSGVNCDIKPDQTSCEQSGCTWTPAPPATSTPPLTASETTAEYVQIVNPIGGTESNKSGTTSIEIIIGNIIKAALGVAGSIALVAFVFGAFTWLTSAGQPEKIKQGAQVMLHAVIGLFIIFASYGILNQVIQALTS